MSAVPRGLTKELVIAYAEYMAREFNANFINKDGDPLMETVGTFLDAINVQDKPMFMKLFTTTIGHNIYIPFVIGVQNEDGSYDLWSQIQVIAHECEHIVQFEGDLKARKDVSAAAEFSWSYVTSEHERAFWEAKAIRTNCELDVWRYGYVLGTAEERASILLHYGIRAEIVKEAEMVIDLSIETIRPTPESNPNIINVSSKKAISWLNQNVPELRQAA